MHKAVTNPRPEAGTAPECAACGHCGSARVVAPLSALVAVNRRHPIRANLGELLTQLALEVGHEAPIAFCPGCLCITTDLWRTHAH